MGSLHTKEHIMSKPLIQLLTAAATLAISGLAGASVAGDQVPSVIVKYGDLALDTRAGVTKLHARLHAAAQLVCSSIDSRVIGLRDQYDVCVADAVSQSVAAVGNANLSDFHRHGAKSALVAANRN
jgi:UrcA family protein